MAGNGDRPFSSRLVLPVAAVIVALEIGAAVRYFLTGDIAGLALVTGSFTLLCGYVFGVSIIRKPE